MTLRSFIFANRRSALYAAGVAMLFWTSASMGQSSESTRQVEHQLDGAADLFQKEGGWEHFQPTMSSLNNGAKESFTVKLSPDYHYQMLGVCDNDCDDLDLYVEDSDGNAIARDDSRNDSTPIVFVSVNQTDTYHVRAVMYSCHHNPCAYGIAIYRRPN